MTLRKLNKIIENLRLLGIEDRTIEDVRTVCCVLSREKIKNIEDAKMCISRKFRDLRKEPEYRYKSITLLEIVTVEEFCEEIVSEYIEESKKIEVIANLVR